MDTVSKISLVIFSKLSSVVQYCEYVDLIYTFVIFVHNIQFKVGRFPLKCHFTEIYGPISRVLLRGKVKFT